MYLTLLSQGLHITNYLSNVSRCGGDPGVSGWSPKGRDGMPKDRHKIRPSLTGKQSLGFAATFRAFSIGFNYG